MLLLKIKAKTMLKRLKMKLATRRVKLKGERSAKAKKANNSKKTPETIRTKVLTTIKKPFIFIGKVLADIWLWIRSIDVIGLINITLLSSIIVLFSVLILDVLGCNKQDVIIITKNEISTAENVLQKTSDFSETIEATEATPALPLKKDVQTRKFIDATITVAKVEKCAVVEKQTARISNTMYGDIIIDSRSAATILKPGDTIKGNLYLQNMRKYILPCNVRIEGNLFLRDLGMLQFCGDFTVTGNIYVSPSSSFGPLPKTARIGGQVII